MRDANSTQSMYGVLSAMEWSLCTLYAALDAQPKNTIPLNFHIYRVVCAAKIGLKNFFFSQARGKGHNNTFMRTCYIQKKLADESVSERTRRAHVSMVLPPYVIVAQNDRNNSNILIKKQ